MFKIAGVQMDVSIGQNEQNLNRIVSAVQETTRNGAQLTVFPECAVPGYCFASLEEAREFAESLSTPNASPTVARLTEVCRATDSFVVTGLLEIDGPRLFNACVLVGPTGLIGAYRKLHLPKLGIDQFTTPGDRAPEVFGAGPIKLGMSICYDGSFPELSRVLALAGAELIVLPTNWPPAAECFAAHTINTRAMENHVYYMSVNRIGTERGFRFIGASRICDPTGKVIVAAEHDDEAILYAEIDPAWARNKHLIRTPGKHEIHRWNDRRPEFYGPVVEAVRRG
jgi:predicted amidohydrolase